MRGGTRTRAPHGSRAVARFGGRGFTLLEVMVAVAILGLGLTIMLSSQAGLLASIRRVQHETYAANLMRCRMTELELMLEREGFSVLDQVESGECCEDEDEPGFSCEWKVEVIELPQPDSFAEDPTEDSEDAKELDEDGLDASGEQGGLGGPLDGPTGVVGALQTINQTEGAALGEGAGLGDLAGTLGDSSGGPGGMISMALGLVYPDLKPMLEASIRKITVSVKWHEGSRERDFTAVQYVTNPLEGSLNPNADAGVDEISNELLNQQAPGSQGANAGTR